MTRTLTRRGRLGAVLRPHASGRRRAARRRLRVTPRMRLAALAIVILAALLFGAWMWVRDSSLVGVDQVTISGASGADAMAIRSALRSSARNMTTLDVQTSRLRAAVASFPEVKGLRVRTVFPHRIVIDVVEERPVAVVDDGGREVPVAGDGTILRAVAVSSTLPTIPLSVPPVGRRLKEGRAAEEVALLGAAPYQLLPKISQVTIAVPHGLVAQLRDGPSSVLRPSLTTGREVDRRDRGSRRLRLGRRLVHRRDRPRPAGRRRRFRERENLRPRREYLRAHREQRQRRLVGCGPSRRELDWRRDARQRRIHSVHHRRGCHG